MNNIKILLIILYFYLSLIYCEIEDDQVYVGFAKEEINPNPKYGPIPLSGYGNSQFRLAEFTEGHQKYMKSLYATCISIKDKTGNTILLLTVDLLSLSRALTNNCLKEINNKTNIPMENIMITAIHTHNAPEFAFNNPNYPDLVYACKNYTELLQAQISKAAINSLKNMKSASIFTKSIDIKLQNGENALNFVRHYSTNNYYKNGDPILNSNHGNYGWKDGKVIYVTKTKHITNADTQLSLLKFEVKNDKDILLVNFQTHPCVKSTSSKTTIDPDFVGDLRDYLDKKLNVKTAYFTGASGNVVHSTQLKDTGIPGVSNTHTINKTQEYFYASLIYASTLGDYILNDTSKFIKMKGGNIKAIKTTMTFNLRTENDTELFNNANYISKIWNAEYADIQKMICGKFDWGNDFVFPKDVDSTGEALREIISIGVDLKQYFIVNETSSSCTCTLGKDINRYIVNTLVTELGLTWDKRIYSPYHANTVITAYNRIGNETSTLPISAFSVGDISFTGGPYEMFDTNGKYISSNSKFKKTFVFELINGAYGYIPSAEAYNYGCYEADTTIYSNGTGEIIANKLLELLTQVKNQVTNIQILQLPIKKQFIINKEKLNLFGGQLNVTYTDGYFKTLPMNNEFINITGFNISKLGKQILNLEYDGIKINLEIEIIKEKKNILLIVSTIVLSLFIISISVCIFILAKKNNNSDMKIKLIVNLGNI